MGGRSGGVRIPDRTIWKVAALSLATLHAQVSGVLNELPEGSESLSRLLRVHDTLTGTIEELRAMIESLRSPRDLIEPDDVLADVLHAAVRDAGITAAVVSVRIGHDILVQRQVAAEVRRIVTGAVTNANRHAHATTIEVHLSREGRQAIVSVADDGIGMADRTTADAVSSAAGGAVGSAGGAVGVAGAPASPTRGAHFGVDVMRLRTAAIGGRLEIRSAPGCGTEVLLRWPEPAT